MLMHNLGFKTIDYKIESNNSYSDFNISVLIEKKKDCQIPYNQWVRLLSNLDSF